MRYNGLNLLNQTYGKSTLPRRRNINLIMDFWILF